MVRRSTVGKPLTPRQVEILSTYARIGDTAAAARRLQLSESTVKNALSAIHHQLGVTSTVAAVWRVFVEQSL